MRRTWLESFRDDHSRLPCAVVDDLVRALNEEFRMFRGEEVTPTKGKRSCVMRLLQ
jgi:hypothetical protein